MMRSIVARFKPLKSACYRGFALALAVVWIAGCTVGPDFTRPSAPATDRYTNDALPPHTAAADADGGNAQRFVPGYDIPEEWWKAFGSNEINTLVARAFGANPSLQAMQAALRVAQENLAAQRGAFYPSLEAAANSTRQKTPTEVSPVLNSGQSLYTLHTAQLQVGYTFDLFGGNRRQVESLQASADSQRFQLEAARITLATNVIAAIVQIASLNEQLSTQQTLVTLQSKQLEIFRTQAKLGEIAEVAAIAQETALAQAEAQIPALRKQLAQQHDLLAALTGRVPSEQTPQTLTFAAIQLPHELPLTLPSKLIEQRPDVRAAEAALHAASAQIGVATAAMLPQITLSANAGSSASQLSDLFRGGGGFWGLTAGVTQPIFQGGALLHKKRAAEATFDQTAAQYRNVVLTGFQNVADTLEALRYDADALEAAAKAERNATQSVAIAQRQLELGDTSYLALLLSEQAYQQSVLSRITAQTSRYADTAALFQALGGGWWNRIATSTGATAAEASVP